MIQIYKRKNIRFGEDRGEHADKIFIDKFDSMAEERIYSWAIARMKFNELCELWKLWASNQHAKITFHTIGSSFYFFQPRPQ